MNHEEHGLSKNVLKKRIGLVLGCAFLTITLSVDSPFQDLSETAWVTMGLAGMMASWWMTEAIPVPATALLPLVVAPLAGLCSINDASSSYAHPLIFLFLGGFLLSLAMERSNLHRRIARLTMLVVGSKPRYQVGGLMLVTAFLSMWMSNTATTVMMLPIALSIITLLKEREDVGSLPRVMLLGLAYSASIGGVATLIGTPPNTLLAAYLGEAYGYEIGFGQWMLFGLPFSMLMLTIAWFFLTRKGLPADSDPTIKEMFRRQLMEMGNLKSAEKKVLVIFVCTAFAWMLRAKLVAWTGLPLTDTSIAMIAALILFILPFGDGSSERVLDWKAAGKVPWGILILFGGGLSLASIIKESGLSDFIGSVFASLGHMDMIWVIAFIALSIVFLTEITSNTATTAGLLPLLGPIAVSMGASPLTLTLPVALAASCAFMMPVATPPNAIVFGSGELEMRDMMRAGFVLNLVSSFLLTLFAAWLAPLVFG